MTRAAKQEKSVWQYLLAGISTALLLLVIAVAVLVIVIPMLTGAKQLTVLTNSMVPTYPPGTLVIVQPVDPQDVRINDVITYQLESGKDVFVTHRVISVAQSTTGERTFITKGDNNSSPDPEPVLPAQLTSGGRVWYSLPWIGYLNNAVGGGGKSWLVIAGAVLLFAYAGWQFGSGLFDRRRKQRKGAGDQED